MFLKRNNPVDVLSEEAANKLLQPHIADFEQCISDSWAEWEKLAVSAPDFRRDIDAVGRAACLNNLIRARIKRKFSGRESEGLRVHEGGGLFMVGIQGKVNLRFKKMTPELLTRNVTTDQQRDLEFQRSLPGMPEATHMSCGYVLDDLGVAITQMAITCRVGKRLVYRVEMMASGKPVTSIFDDQSSEGTKTEVRVIAPPTRLKTQGE